MTSRPIHPDFNYLLHFRDADVIELFTGLRQNILELYPDSNELLYHTHVLTAVFSLSERLSDAFCHVPVYSDHINLGFNKGTLLHDPNGLLRGTGKLIRHIRVKKTSDFRNAEVQMLIKAAIDLALSDMDKPVITTGKTISKIKSK